MDALLASIVIRFKDQVLLVFALTFSLISLIFYITGWLINPVETVSADRSERKDVHFQVDLNTAEWPELMILPGIGEKLAKGIVNHREQLGEFSIHDQLREVTGIGEIKHQQLIPFCLPLDVSTNRPLPSQRRSTAGH